MKKEAKNGRWMKEETEDEAEDEGSKMKEEGD
jgi:hypothetical protein